MNKNPRIVIALMSAGVLLGFGCGQEAVTTAGAPEPSATAPPAPPVEVAHPELKDGRDTTVTFPLPPPPASPAVDSPAIDQASASEHLQQMRTVLGGQNVFMPAPLTFHAQRTSAQALAAVKSKGGAYANADKVAQGAPEIFFTLFSGGGGTIDPSTNAVTRKYTNLPAWVVVYHGVPDYGSGPSSANAASAPAGGVTEARSPAEIHDITFIVSDVTGEALMAISE